MVDKPEELNDTESSSSEEEEKEVKNSKNIFKDTIKPLLKDTYQDFRNNFQPGVITTLCAFILFCIPFGLGIWQIQRLQWKTALLADIAEKQNSYIYDFSVINPFQDWQSLNYRRAFAVGDFMFLRSIKLKPRTYKGQVGYHLLTPMRLQDGGTIIVNRGWVPEGHHITEEYWNAENVKITGILKQAKKPNRFTPENKPKNNEWYWPDIHLISQHVGIDRVAPIIFYQDHQEAETDQDISYPIGGQINLNIRNNHKAYATTWFLLAVSLVIVWFFYSWKSPPSKKENESAPENSQEISDDNAAHP